MAATSLQGIEETGDSRMSLVFQLFEGTEKVASRRPIALFPLATCCVVDRIRKSNPNRASHSLTVCSRRSARMRRSVLKSSPQAKKVGMCRCTAGHRVRMQFVVACKDVAKRRVDYNLGMSTALRWNVFHSDYKFPWESCSQREFFSCSMRSQTSGMKGRRLSRPRFAFP